MDGVSSSTTVGYFLLACAFVSFFMGMLSCQVTRYSALFPKDHRYVKSLVGVVYGLSILQMLAIFGTCWMAFISKVSAIDEWHGSAVLGHPSGRLTTPFSLPWPLWVEPMLEQSIVFLCQGYFAWRCYQLNERKRFIFVIVSIVLTGSLASVALFGMIGLGILRRPFAVAVDGLAVVIAGVSLNFVCDVVITGTMTCKLLRSRKHFSRRTDTALNKFLAIVWEAAIPPALAALLGIVSLVIPSTKQTLLYMFFNMIIPRLYVFSLMFTLNERKTIEAALNASHDPYTVPRTPVTPRRSVGLLHIRLPREPPTSKSPIIFTGATISFAHPTPGPLDTASSIAMEAISPSDDAPLTGIQFSDSASALSV